MYFIVSEAATQCAGIPGHYLAAEVSFECPCKCTSSCQRRRPNALGFQAITSLLKFLLNHPVNVLHRVRGGDPMRWDSRPLPRCWSFFMLARTICRLWITSAGWISIFMNMYIIWRRKKLRRHVWLSRCRPAPRWDVINSDRWVRCRPSTSADLDRFQWC